ELIGLTVNVDITAREMRPHQRIAARDDAIDELIDERILGAAQRRDVEPRGGQEGARIDAAAMGRIENRRAAPLNRLENLEGGIELIFDVVHGSGFLDGGVRYIGYGIFWLQYARRRTIVHGHWAATKNFAWVHPL